MDENKNKKKRSLVPSPTPSPDRRKSLNETARWAAELETDPLLISGGQKSAPRMRELRIQKHEPSPYSAEEPTCTRCRARGPFWTLDVQVSALPADRGGSGPEVPAGWCALIGLCPHCLDRLAHQICNRVPGDEMDGNENKK